MTRPVLDAGSLVLVAVAVGVGSFLNHLVGFGFALVTVPLLSLAVGPVDAVVLSAVYGLLSNGGVVVRHRAEAEADVVRRLVLGSLIGMPFGLVVLLVLPAAPLQVGIALTVLAAVVVLARGWELADPHPSVDVVAGLVSGVLNTSVGVSGPPVVADLQGRRLPKGRFRASAAAYFTCSGVVALALFAASGQIDLSLVAAAALALPAWPVGAALGDRLHRRFPDDRFRHLVLVLLVLTALVTLAGALRA